MTLRHADGAYPSVQKYGEVGTPFRSCQFPMWDDREVATGVFCGRAIAKGSYCAHHHAVCYRRPGDPRPTTPPEWAAPQVTEAPEVEEVVVHQKEPRPRMGKRGRSFGDGGIRTPIPDGAWTNAAQRSVALLYNAGHSHGQIVEATGAGSVNAVAGMISKMKKRGPTFGKNGHSANLIQRLAAAE